MQPARVLLSALICATASLARAAEPPPLDLSQLPSDDELVRLLWEHSPDLAEARGRIGQAEAEVIQSQVLPNPTLSLQVGTIAVGTTNPPGLNPFSETANYSANLGWLVELGKRGPRQRAAAFGLDATRLLATETLRQRYLDLQHAIARIAAAQVRLAAIADLIADAERLTELERARAEHGESAGLEAARAELEEETLRAQQAEERAHLHEAVIACSELVGRDCLPPTDREKAAAVLSRLRALEVKDEGIRERPDLQALTRTRDAAEAKLDLAHAQAIPDPTFTAGYTKDQLLVAGNQPRSFTVGVSVPLPLFDHGQAGARTASAEKAAAEAQRTRLETQARRDVALLRAQLAEVTERRQRLENHSLPLARSVVDRMQKAVAQGGASLSELLLARRSLGELTLSLADLDLRELDLRFALARAAGAGPRALPPSTN